MPRFDPQIEVLCDGCGCTEYWQPEYVYHDYSGRSGQYDTDDAAFAKWCKQEKWTFEGEETFCPDCSYDPEEPDQ